MTHSFICATCEDQGVKTVELDGEELAARCPVCNGTSWELAMHRKWRARQDRIWFLGILVSSAFVAWLAWLWLLPIIVNGG